MSQDSPLTNRFSHGADPGGRQARRFLLLERPALVRRAGNASSLHDLGTVHGRARGNSEAFAARYGLDCLAAITVRRQRPGLVQPAITAVLLELDTVGRRVRRNVQALVAHLGHDGDARLAEVFGRPLLVRSAGARPLVDRGAVRRRIAVHVEAFARMVGKDGTGHGRCRRGRGWRRRGRRGERRRIRSHFIHRTAVVLVRNEHGRGAPVVRRQHHAAVADTRRIAKGPFELHVRVIVGTDVDDVLGHGAIVRLRLVVHLEAVIDSGEHRADVLGIDRFGVTPAVMEIRILRLDRDTAIGLCAHAAAGSGGHVLEGIGPQVQVGGRADIDLAPFTGRLRQDIEAQVFELHSGVGRLVALGLKGGKPRQDSPCPGWTLAGPPTRNGVAARGMHRDFRIVLPVKPRIDHKRFARRTHIGDGLVDRSGRHRRRGGKELCRAGCLRERLGLRARGIGGV